MVFIFMQSALPAVLSQKESGLISTLIRELLHINKDISSFLVRKSAHFTEYFFLGISLMLTVKEWLYESVDLPQAGSDSKKPENSHELPGQSDLVPFLLSWGIGTLYAVTDEFHQSFVPDRSCELRDIIIDSLGVLTGILIVMIISKIISHMKN